MGGEVTGSMKNKLREDLICRGNSLPDPVNDFLEVTQEEMLSIHRLAKTRNNIEVNMQIINKQPIIFFRGYKVKIKKEAV